MDYYEIRISRPGQQSRVVAAGSLAAMQAVQRLYGGRDQTPRGDERPAGMVGQWCVDQPGSSATLWVRLSERTHLGRPCRPPTAEELRQADQYYADNWRAEGRQAAFDARGDADTDARERGHAYYQPRR